MISGIGFKLSFQSKINFQSLQYQQFLTSLPCSKWRIYQSQARTWKRQCMRLAGGTLPYCISASNESQGRAAARAPTTFKGSCFIQMKCTCITHIHRVCAAPAVCSGCEYMFYMHYKYCAAVAKANGGSQCMREYCTRALIYYRDVGVIFASLILLCCTRPT